ncbi:AraC family transcriptional regulator [Bacteroides sp. ET225]|uniref:helix-turn-helix domain-containing protein n=1 Tax=Bacteroides sp. ET225 TaxID=2972461 RepID=UPI0021AC9422|nr:helix-turn-helix domain-containing protein [Bacteroides sp. ET225]MCR8916836.1 helix-turn-helix domain-containing protein [Bacteroides sp. ET225]
MEQTAYQMLDIGQLLANDATVSQNKYGFFLCRKGEADILLDNHSFHIEAGVLCLYTPYTFIRIIRHTDNIEGCLMEGELDTIQSALSNIPAAERFAIRSHPCVKLGTAECQRLEQAVEMLAARTELLRKAEKPRSVRLLHTLVQALLQALCLEVLEIYFNCTTIEELPQNREEKIFNRFLMSVFRNCNKERSVTFYAREQHLSPNYLSTIVKNQSGRTAIQWIETFTLLQAQHYLLQTRLSIKEIAYQLHFPDQSVFGRYFKKHCGVSPTDYRNRKRI